MANKSHALDFYLELSKGRIPGHIGINKFGYNLDVDTTTLPETIWSYGGQVPFPSGFSALSISSSSTNDTSGGTGAIKIKIQGLDNNYDIIEEEVTLNGTSTVNSTVYSNWHRIHRAFVTEAGSLEQNAGNINISIGSDVVAQIPAGHSQTQQAVYTIPAGYKGYIVNFSGAIIRSGNNKSASIVLYKRVNNVSRSIQEIAVQSDGVTNINKTYTIPITIEEKADVYVNAISINADNTNIFSNFGLVIFK